MGIKLVAFACLLLSGCATSKHHTQSTPPKEPLSPVVVEALDNELEHLDRKFAESYGELTAAIQAMPEDGASSTNQVAALRLAGDMNRFHQNYATLSSRFRVIIMQHVDNESQNKLREDTTRKLADPPQ